MIVRLESAADDPSRYDATVRDVLKLRGAIELVSPGTLPKDGIVIEDTRVYD